MCVSVTRALVQGSLAFLLFGALTACAPRSGKTHFDRWAAETQRLKEEEALEVKEKEWLRAQVGGAPAPAQGAPASAPPPGGGRPSGIATQPPSSYSSLSSGGGSRTSTGTKSRVIKPAEETPPVEEEDPIY